MLIVVLTSVCPRSSCTFFYAFTEQIQQTEQEIDRRLDKLLDILRDEGYPDVQAFMSIYREAKAVVEQ